MRDWNTETNGIRTCESDVYIAYERRVEDSRWAKWLFSEIKAYRVPVRLVKERSLPPKVKPVLDDGSGDRAGEDGGIPREAPLEGAKFLIIVCSPFASVSRHLNDQIARFRELGKGDQILALLIDGDPRVAFPHALREIRREMLTKNGTEGRQVEEVEPLAADVRPVRGVSLKNRKNAAKLMLLARILGISFDDLRQRDAARRRRRRARLFGISIALILLVSFLGLYAQTQYALQLSAESSIAKTTSLRDNEAQRTTEQAAAATDEANRAAAIRRLRQWRDYLQQIQQVRRHWTSGNCEAAQDILTENARAADSSDENLHGVEWQYWKMHVARTNGIRAFEHNAHSGSVYAIKISPDEQFVVASNHQHAGMWNLQNGDAVWQQEFSKGTFESAPIAHKWDHSVCFSSDGQLVAAVSKGVLAVWRSMTGESHFQINDSRIAGRTVVVSPDCQSVITDCAVTGNSWLRWNLEDKAEISHESQQFGSVSSLGTIPNFIFDTYNESPVLVTGLNSVWSWPSGKPLQSSHMNGRPTTQFTSLFPRYPGQPMFVEIQADKSLQMIGGEPVLYPGRPPSMRLLDRHVVCVDGSRTPLAVAHENGSVRIIRELGTQTDFRGPSPTEYHAVSLSKTIVVSLADGVIRSWKLDGSEAEFPLPQFDSDLHLNDRLVAAANPDRNANRVTWSRDGSFVAEIPWDQATVESRKLIADKYGQAAADGLSFLEHYYKSAQSRFVACGGIMSGLTLWDTVLKQSITVECGDEACGFAQPIARHFSENDEFCAFIVMRTGVSSGVRVIRCKTGEECLKVYGPMCKHVCLSANGKYVAFGMSQFLHVYEVKSKSRKFFRGLTVSEIPLGFDLNETRVVTSENIYDVETGDVEIAPLFPIPTEMVGAAIAADGRRAFFSVPGRLIVVACEDGSMLADIPCKGTPNVEEVMRLYGAIGSTGTDNEAAGEAARGRKRRRAAAEDALVVDNESGGAERLQEGTTWKGQRSVNNGEKGWTQTCSLLITRRAGAVFEGTFTILDTNRSMKVEGKLSKQQITFATVNSTATDPTRLSFVGEVYDSMLRVSFDGVGGAGRTITGAAELNLQ